MYPTFRVVMIGNAFAGKTSLVTKYIMKSCPGSYEETIGASFRTYTSKIEGEMITVQVWDTAGQEKYRSLGPVYYRNALAAIVVYDKTDRQSFADIPSWIDTFRATAGTDTHIFIVGNKADIDDKIAVDTQEGQKFAEELGSPFFETSAVSGLNVDFLFQSVAETVYHNRAGCISKSAEKQDLRAQSQGEKKCC